MKDEFMIRQTAEYCYRVTSHQGLKFDKAKASDYVQKTYRVRFKEILDEVRKDADAASFGIPTKKPTRIQVEAAKVALHHGLVKYAEEIVRACPQG